MAVGIAPLGATPVEELCGRGECVAGVLTPRAGSPGCSALFAMEPEDAFALLCVAPVDASAPLEAYVALGAAFGRAVAEALGASPPDAPCLATLEEDAAIAILLRTHAPSDTPLASVELALAVADRVEQLGEWRAHLHCLVDAKLAVPGPR
ncbi:MAG: hypothetical protein KC560_15210 [Myxococcales bacterium]|nr:hypothetical protein [Myxococcales bacterium]